MSGASSKASCCCRSATRVGDLVGREPRHALGAELLDVVRGQRGAVGHRARERGRGRSASPPLRRDVADEAAGEAVARAGRVDDLGQRIGGQGEEALRRRTAPRRTCPAWPRRPAGPSSAAPRAAARRSSALPVSCSSSSSLRIRQSTERIVLIERVARDVDPQVHRVHRDEARAAALLAHARAAARAGCWPGRARRSPARRLRELGLEVGEDVEVGVVRDALVEVVAVLAGPEERLAAGHVLDVVGDGAARLQDVPVLGAPKSSPTGPTARTSSKNDAARLKWVAAPPSMRSRAPNGVLTASKAMDPTTVRLMEALSGRDAASMARVIAATQPTRSAPPGRLHARDPADGVRRPRGARARRAARCPSPATARSSSGSRARG